jgi:hypothetical protein
MGPDDGVGMVTYKAVRARTANRQSTEGSLRKLVSNNGNNNRFGTDTNRPGTKDDRERRSQYQAQPLSANLVGEECRLAFPTKLFITW